jgi:hypothetical protein
MAGEFQAYLEQENRRTARIEGAAGAATETMAAGGANLLKDRWWKKEHEEFRDTAVAELKEKLSQIGNLSADETADDVQGAWGIYQSAIIDFMDKAGEYPQNPYISQLGQKMFTHSQQMFGDLTQGVQQAAAAEAHREGAITERELRGPRKERIEAQTEQAQAAARASDRKPAALGLPKQTDFGAADTFRTIPPVLWMEKMRASKGYRDLEKAEVATKAESAWDQLSDEEKSRYMMAGTEEQAKRDFAENYGLSADERRNLDVRSAAMLVGQLHGPTMDPYIQGALVNQLVGPKQQLLEDVRKAAPKIGKNQQLRENSNPLYTLIFGKALKWAEEGANPIEEPYTPSELKDKFPGSPADQVVTEYLKLRKEGKEHADAVVELARSTETGPSLLDKLVVERFSELDVKDPGQDKNITHFRRALIDMLEAYRKDYEKKIVSGELWKSGYMSEAGAEWLKQKLLNVPILGTLSRAPLSGLAGEGIRTGAEVGEPTSTRPFLEEEMEAAIETGAIPSLFRGVR